MAHQSAEKWSLRQFFNRSIIELENSAQTDVGRSIDCSLCLRWGSLSPRHAAFVVNMYGNLMVRDLNSNAGTFVNGLALPPCENKVLAHGDIVSFGLARFWEATTIPMRMCFFEVIAENADSTPEEVEEKVEMEVEVKSEVKVEVKSEVKVEVKSELEED